MMPRSWQYPEAAAACRRLLTDGPVAGGPAAQVPCTQALAHPSLRGSGQL